MNELIDGEKLLKDDSKLFILYFTATWCGPCKRIYPLVNSIIKKLPEQYKELFLFYKVDIDDNDEICTKYDISSVPTFILLDNDDTIIDTFTGNGSTTAYTLSVAPPNENYATNILFTC